MPKQGLSTIRASRVMIAAAITSTISVAATASYTLVDLGNLGGKALAVSLNNEGQVVGQASLPDGNYHAFLWSQNTGMIDLGTLPGDPRSSARSINDAGQIVGTSQPVGGNPPRAFLWQPGTGMIDIGASAGLSASVSGINNGGQVVGNASSDGFMASQFGFTYKTSGGVVPVTISGAPVGEVFAVNNRGQMAVGTEASQDASFYSPGQPPIEIQGSGLITGAVLAINDQGTVVGDAMASASDNSHAFVWNLATGLVDITPVPNGNAFATSINNEDQVVGYETLFDGSSLGFLYDHGTLYDLSKLLGNAGIGWTSLTPHGINDLGQIAGSGYFDGQLHAILLTPTAVPEPATAAVLLLSAALLLRRRHPTT